jgi:hypothetical protein
MKKSTKMKDKETRTDETNEDGEKESKIVKQQVVAAAAADGPRAVLVAVAAGTQAGMMPHGCHRCHINTISTLTFIVASTHSITSIIIGS